MAAAEGLLLTKEFLTVMMVTVAGFTVGTVKMIDYLTGRKNNKKNKHNPVDLSGYATKPEVKTVATTISMVVRTLEKIDERHREHLRNYNEILGRVVFTDTCDKCFKGTEKRFDSLDKRSEGIERSQRDLGKTQVQILTKITDLAARKGG